MKIGRPYHIGIASRATSKRTYVLSQARVTDMLLLALEYMPLLVSRRLLYLSVADEADSTSGGRVADCQSNNDRRDMHNTES